MKPKALAVCDNKSSIYTGRPDWRYAFILNVSKARHVRLLGTLKKVVNNKGLLKIIINV
jgi:hypothetical protein